MILHDNEPLGRFQPIGIPRPSVRQYYRALSIFGTGDKLDNEMTKALAPGSTAIIQPKTNHFAWTSEETVIQLHPSS
jgi:hypothetical protein